MNFLSCNRLITSAIAPEASAVITEGNIIRTRFDEKLDQYRVVLRDGTGWIAEIEAKEREASGITGLKIDYNKKDGYYFHVTTSIESTSCSLFPQGDLEKFRTLWYGGIGSHRRRYARGA